MTKAKEAICASCGRKRVIVAKGLCKSCYNREYTAKNRPGNSQPVDLTLESMFTCQRLHCRMAVRHCLTYQARVQDGWTLDHHIPYRESCQDCPQGKVIAAAVKNNDVEALKAQDATKYMRQSEIVQQRGDLVAKRPNETHDKTLKCEEEKNDMAEASNKPGSVKMCAKCGGRPEINPVTHLCAECHSEWVKSTRGKAKQTIQDNLARNFGMDKWVGVALSQWPDLQAAIEDRARQELRTPEAQAVWMLRQMVEGGDAT